MVRFFFLSTSSNSCLFTFFHCLNDCSQRWKSRSRQYSAPQTWDCRCSSGSERCSMDWVQQGLDVEDHLAVKLLSQSQQPCNTWCCIFPALEKRRREIGFARRFGHGISFIHRLCWSWSVGQLFWILSWLYPVNWKRSSRTTSGWSKAWTPSLAVPSPTQQLSKIVSRLLCSASGFCKRFDRKSNQTLTFLRKADKSVALMPPVMEATCLTGQGKTWWTMMSLIDETCTTIEDHFEAVPLWFSNIRRFSCWQTVSDKHPRWFCFLAVGSIRNADTFAHGCFGLSFQLDWTLTVSSAFEQWLQCISDTNLWAGTLDLRALQQILGKTDPSSNEQWFLVWTDLVVESSYFELSKNAVRLFHGTSRAAVENISDRELLGAQRVHSSNSQRVPSPPRLAMNQATHELPKSMLSHLAAIILWTLTRHHPLKS